MIIQRPYRFAFGVLRGLALLGLCVLAFVALVCGAILAQGGRDETRQANAAIVLGAAQWAGEPSPVLRARLDRALELYRRGTVSRIILTGGVGEGDSVAEATAGREYLSSRGVPPEALLAEESGMTTLASLTNAVAVARSNGIESVLLVSNDYHMLRSLKIAHDLGLDATASPIHTSAGLTAESAAHVVREAGAYIVYLFARQ